LPHVAQAQNRLSFLQTAETEQGSVSDPRMENGAKPLS
jgi:hypothetical protein